MLIVNRVEETVTTSKQLRRNVALNNAMFVNMVQVKNLVPQLCHLGKEE